MKEILTIYSYVDGTNDVPFYDSDNPIALTEYTYTTQRMGASSLSAPLMHGVCLDNHWDGKQYVTFKGTKFFLKGVPSSSKNNEDERYHHSLEFAPERDIILANTYFIDAVSEHSTGDDKYKTNSSRVIFTGDISEFVNRIHQSMSYSGLEFTAHVKNGVTSEIKTIAFDDLTIFDALQQAYEIYGVPFYFVGKEIWFGYTDNVIDEPFEYGAENELLSISKNNANSKIVTRCTGTGSEDNIPYYYPNNSPKGNISAEAGTQNSGLFTSGIVISDAELFSQKVGLNDTLQYVSPEVSSLATQVNGFQYNQNGEYFGTPLQFAQRALPTPTFVVSFNSSGSGVVPLSVNWEVVGEEDGVVGYAEFDRVVSIRKDGELIPLEPEDKDELVEEWEDDRGCVIEIPIEGSGLYRVEFKLKTWLEGHPDNRGTGYITVNIGVPTAGWMLNNEIVNLKDVGLSLTQTPSVGDIIVQRKNGWITPSGSLMPPIYRQSMGAERFYNAINREYLIPGSTTDTYEFKNEYVSENPREHIVDFPDIKPTIEGMKNASGQIMAQFLAVDFDNDDNDDIDENGNLIHPYFYVKLPKFNGQFGFNLFDHAIDEGEMTFSMKTGPCAGCNFVLGVSNDEFQQNIVQVNDDGSLKKENGRVVLGKPQERQNDTINYEVWVALKKEDSTFGVLMPNKGQNYRPTAGNQFAILHILLPQAYIAEAENRLKEAIIKFMSENNSDKFNFSINFSRVFFAENAGIYNQIDENARIYVTYNGQNIPLYITSYTYRATDGESLPEITVELAENILTSRNALQSTIDEIRGAISGSLTADDILAAGSPYFVSKQQDDVVAGYLKFLKGILLGENSSLTVDEDGNASAVVDFLKVNKKAVFNEIEIQEKRHVGGQLIVSLAAITCNKVEEVEGAYRCFFEADAEKGEGVDNLFAIDDQAICQTFNAWGNKYYWRKVVNVGFNYIDLSIEDCDANSDIPSVGDKIVQLGNRTVEARQNAIAISAYGEDAPSIIQYKGISAYEINDSQIVTKIAPDDNMFTGRVHIMSGSDGFENLAGSLNIGGYNLLRNSGFTGDYLSEPLADQTVMEAAKELYSDPLDHWQTNGAATVIDLENAASGKAVTIVKKDEENGYLGQVLNSKIILGESYVISFYAIGTGTMTVECGGVTQSVELAEEWNKSVLSFEATATDEEFSIFVDDEVTIYDLQLERGTIATAWSPNYLDNSSDRAYYQSLQYLQAALKGSTIIDGGLILSSLIQLGKESNNSEFVPRAGMSGLYDDDNSPAFWAGGDIEKAIALIDAFRDNPNAQLSDEQIASMAKFATTHGGRVIMNDGIFRGAIYAKEGVFGDLKIGKYVNACGFEDAEESVYTENNYTKEENGRKYSTVAKLYDGSLRAYSSSFDNSVCYQGNSVVINPDSDSDNNVDAVIQIEANTTDAINIWRGNFRHNFGVHYGLRTCTKVISTRTDVNSPAYLDLMDYNILIEQGSGICYLELPSILNDGQEYIIESLGAAVNIDGISHDIYRHDTMTRAREVEISSFELARLKYYSGAGYWTLTLIR